MTGAFLSVIPGLTPDQVRGRLMPDRPQAPSDIQVEGKPWHTN